MFVMFLLAILCTAVISMYLFMGRNLERLMGTQQQDVKSRRVLRQFAQDVSSAISFSSITSPTSFTCSVPTAFTLANCSTTLASTTVTCTSTSSVAAGMSISGTGVPALATISSVTNATTLVMSASATATGSGLTLSATSTTTITYLFDSAAGTLTRQVGGATPVTLLTSITTAGSNTTNGFVFYNTTGTSTTSTLSAKEAEFAFTTASGNATIGTQASIVIVSPRVPIKNKAILQ